MTAGNQVKGLKRSLTTVSAGRSPFTFSGLDCARHAGCVGVGVAVGKCRSQISSRRGVLAPCIWHLLELHEIHVYMSRVCACVSHDVRPVLTVSAPLNADAGASSRPRSHCHPQAHYPEEQGMTACTPPPPPPPHASVSEVDLIKIWFSGVPLLAP